MNDEVEPSVLRADRFGLQSVLGDLEAETMNAIWEHAHGRGITVREAHQILKLRRPIAYTTVMTTMARLAKKNLLRASKASPAYVYYPTMSKAEFTSSFVGRVLDQLLQNYSGAAMSHFAELADPESREEVLQMLRDIIRRRKPLEDDSGAEDDEA